MRFPDRFYNEDGAFCLAAGDRTFSGCMMQGADLMYAKVAYADLTGADLYWAMCCNANMEAAILNDCDFRGVTFKEANLRGAARRHGDPPQQAQAANVMQVTAR
jgi:uncharacterized protein YjbI with pentapeptide repeats